MQPRFQTAAREDFKNRLKAGFDGTPLAVSNNTNATTTIVDGQPVATTIVDGQPVAATQQLPFSQAPLAQVRRAPSGAKRAAAFSNRRP